MSIYRNFCREELDENGTLTAIRFDYPDNFNFGYDVVDAITAQTPHKRAIVWCDDEGGERTVDFAQVAQMSSRAANVFRAAGIGRGDYVMVALKRHIEYWYVAVALHKLGAVMIPVTHMLTEKDFAYRMGCVALKGIVCTPQGDLHERIRSAAQRHAPGCTLFTVREERPGFQNLTSAMEQASPVLERQQTHVHDPMLLYFTSGTTGYPKGVIHDFSYPLAHIVTAKYWQRATDGGLHFTVAETGWAKASWGKLYGQWLVGSAVMVYDFDHFDPKKLTGIINKYGVTSFCAPPTVYRYLARKGIPDMPSLRHAVTAGEQLDPNVSRRFTERTGLVLAEGYGQTESTLLVGNFLGQQSVVGSLGVPSPMYRIRVQNPDGSETAAGQIGEVVVVPPEEGKVLGLFTGYLGDPDRYARVWQGGVYHTGDAAWRDESGHFWFHGRVDDLIKTGGFRVGPTEIEHVLAEHPAVAECAVVGVPDPLRGQAIKAYVVPAEGYAPGKELEKELHDFANGQLAEYKWIRIVEFTQLIPRTISGKICKAALNR